MKQKDFTGIVPDQYTGEEIETQSSIDLKNENEAQAFYEVAKARLLNVNSWHFIAGMVSGKFQLTDAHGEKLNRNVEIGDYFRIDIPGPGSSEGDGYDWVYVEDLKEITEENVQSIGFRVRPSENPLGEKNEIAHFYTDDATSNFIVTREGNTVTAIIIDRNLKPNDESESKADRIRHVAVGIGAIGLFSKIQWKNLTDGLVKEVKE
jgi:hypothetical protein